MVARLFFRTNTRRLREIVNIVAYFVGIVLLGSFLAPALYWAGRATAQYGVLTFLAETEFQKFFNRAMLVAAVVLLWALLVGICRFPPLARRLPQDAESSAGGFGGLLAFPRYWLGVLAQFAYVGAQVGVWSFVIRYTQFNTPGTAEKVAANNLLITLVVFFAGRFVGTLLMSKFRPATLLALFAAADVALCVVAALAGGDIGLYSLMATSFFMSIQFPTIFTTSLRGLGTHTKSGSSFLVMAIVGGAIIPPVMGLVSDASSINTAMLIPALCFAVVWLFGMKSRGAAAA